MDHNELYEVPEDYTEQLERSKVRGIYETLIAASENIAGPSMVISNSVDSKYIRLWNSPAQMPQRCDVERSALIPKGSARDLAACLVYWALNGDLTDELGVQGSFSFPASQVEGVARAIVRVAEYDGKLPFYAENIIRQNPSWN